MTETLTKYLYHTQNPNLVGFDSPDAPAEAKPKAHKAKVLPFIKKAA